MNSCASMLSAQTSGAMLYANGNVEVNGRAAGISNVVLSGDRVDVSQSSAGSINSNGSSVVISPNSSIQFEPASVEVLQGGARVSTTKGMSASAGQVVVSPKNKDAVAKFDVVKSENKVVVVSREGALTVKDGDRIMTVAAGSTTELPIAPVAGQTSAQASGAASANFLASNRLSEHPFYGVVKGVETSPATLPICAATVLCIRSSVSQIPPCCCPPRILCQQ